jgi:hypothetical protein
MMKSEPRPGELIESELAQRICSMDDAIMFCIMINSNGEVQATASRPGSNSFVQNKSDIELLAKRLTVARGIDATADKLFGPSRSAMIFRDRTTLMIIRAADGSCAFVGARPDFDNQRIREIEKAVAGVSL